MFELRDLEKEFIKNRLKDYLEEDNLAAAAGEIITCPDLSYGLNIYTTDIFKFLESLGLDMAPAVQEYIDNNVVLYKDLNLPAIFFGNFQVLIEPDLYVGKLANFIDLYETYYQGNQPSDTSDVETAEMLWHDGCIVTENETVKLCKGTLVEFGSVFKINDTATKLVRNFDIDLSNSPGNWNRKDRVVSYSW